MSVFVRGKGRHSVCLLHEMSRISGKTLHTPLRAVSVHASFVILTGTIRAATAVSFLEKNRDLKAACTETADGFRQDDKSDVCRGLYGFLRNEKARLNRRKR